MAKISFPYAPLRFGTVFGVITHDSPKQSLRHGFTQSAVPPPFTQRKLSHGDVCEQVGHVRKTFAFRWELYRLRAPRRGARLAARVRGSAATIRNRSCKQNSPPIPVRAVCLRRRHPTRGFVCTSILYFSKAEGAGDHRSPLQIKMEFAHRDDVRITQKRTCFSICSLILL